VSWNTVRTLLDECIISQEVEGYVMAKLDDGYVFCKGMRHTVSMIKEYLAGDGRTNV